MCLCGRGIFAQDIHTDFPGAHALFGHSNHPTSLVTGICIKAGGQKRKECVYSKCTSLWGAEPATEQDALGVVVCDEEKERVVCTKPWFGSAAPSVPDHGCGPRRLRALFVHFYKALVRHLGHGHVLLRRHSRKVCLGFLKRISHT